MRYIKTYENYSNELKTDSYAIKFLNGEITSLQLENYIFKTNEGIIGDAINWVQEKLIKVLYTFVVTFNKIKNNVIPKVLSFITGIMGKIKSFKEKHPVLFKSIIIFIVIILILIFTESSASAAELVDGKNPPTENLSTLNSAIGWIEHEGMSTLKEMGIKDDMDVQQLLFDAKTYLMDLRDGKIDNPIEASKLGIEFANGAIECIKDNIKLASETKDGQLMQTLVHYAEDGTKHILTTVGTK